MDNFHSGTLNWETALTFKLIIIILILESLPKILVCLDNYINILIWKSMVYKHKFGLDLFLS
jgi:hypothetical protein